MRFTGNLAVQHADLIRTDYTVAGIGICQRLGFRHGKTGDQRLRGFIGQG
jgi:hypothetical protein